MFRGFISVWQNNLDLVLAKILIKERENFSQLANCGTNYIGDGLHYSVYGGKQFQVLRDGCEVLRRKNSQILKRIKSYK